MLPTVSTLQVLANMFVSLILLLIIIIIIIIIIIMVTVLLLQRWERENAKLPPHMQRAAPEKPSSPLTVEQWNAFAWEASQVCGT